MYRDRGSSPHIPKQGNAGPTTTVWGLSPCHISLLKHELLTEREGHAASRWVISPVPVSWRGDPRSRVKRKANIEVLTIESRRGDHPLRTGGATIPIELAGGLPTPGGTVGRLLGNNRSRQQQHVVCNMPGRVICSHPEVGE